MFSRLIRIRLWIPEAVVPFLIMVSGLPSTAPSQTVESVITGRVTDASTGIPLQSVNVYLSGTTLGASTDSAGLYRISIVPTGEFELVASLLGYERAVHSVHIGIHDSLHYDHRLTPRLLSAPGVEISASPDAEWQNQLEQFLKIFIGDGEPARNCTVLNPGVLSFTTGQDTLRVRSDSILILDNTWLGYRIHIFLKEFTWITDRDYGSYLMYPFFEPLQPRGAEESAAWEENRRTAYRGSLKHFLHAIYRGTIQAERFTVFAGPIGKILKGRGHRLSPQDLVPEPYGEGSLKILRFQGCLRVEYGRSLEQPFQTGGKYNREILRQRGTNDPDAVSFLCLRYAYCVIDPAGNLIDPLSVEVAGGWRKSRVAELLPMY